MIDQAVERSVLRRLLPQWLRRELYYVRRAGPRNYVRQAWLYLRQPRKPTPQANAPFDIGAPVPIVLHASTVDGFRSQFVASRHHSTDELDAFKRIAAAHSTLLDVGAGVGIFAAAFCALTGKQAYAFEPSPTMFARLQALVEVNPDFQIAAFNIGLGAATGAQEVGHSGTQFRAVDSSGDAIETMAVETLDDFVSRYQLAPDVAKIDVEGMELEVLRGGGHTFRHLVDEILLEVHPRMLIGGKTPADVEMLLTDFGFELLTLDFSPIPDLTRYVAADRRRARATHIVCRRQEGREGRSEADA